MKKIVSIVLALAMIFSLSAPVFADTVTSTESNSNSASASVKAYYTPSTSTADEAKWGASKDSLPNSGYLAQAIKSAKTDSTIKYIQLQKNIEASESGSISGGVFTLDLNGFTRMSTEGDAIIVSGDSTDVTLTDTSEGKTGGLKTTDTQGKAISVRGGKLTVQCGSFTSAGDYALEVQNGTVAVQGGSYGSAGIPMGVWGGTLTVTGGSFTHGTSGASILYSGGLLDLSGYPTGAKEGTTPLTDIKVKALSAVTVGDTTIKLPEGYAFYKSDDADKTTVTELAEFTTYGIKSTSGGTTTKYDVTVDSTITNGTVTANPTSAAAGDTITLTMTPATDYALDKLTVTYGDNNTTVTTTAGENNTYTFTMPAGAVTVRATFKSTKVEITGVTVTIDGTEYSSTNTSATGPAKITPDTTSVIYTIKGTNLDQLTDRFALRVNDGVAVQKNRLAISLDGNSATATMFPENISAWLPSVTEAFGVTYTLDGSTWVNTGVYYVYDGGTATITGVSVKVGDTTYTSGQTVTLTPASGDVTLIVTGTNLKNATADNMVNFRFGCAADMKNGAENWFKNDAGTEARLEISLEEFESCTTAFEIRYSNDNQSTWTSTGIYIQYQAETTNVDITWGSLAFVYSDEQVSGAEKGWTCDADANTVKVENKGSSTIEAGVVFTKSTTAENITNVTGTFDKSEATLISSASASASGSSGTSGTVSTTATFTLTLSGKPDGALSNATIGSVTVTISKAD